MDGIIVQQLLGQFFDSGWHDCSTVTCTNSLKVAGTIFQELLVHLFNSHWCDCSTVTDIFVQIVQESIVRLLKRLR